jgi:hypothetical protein
MELAGALLVEAALVRRDLEDLDMPHGEELLDRAAADARVTRRLGAAESDYLGALRSSHESGRAGALALPVRLLRRLAELDLTEALDGDAERAAAWEAAAVLNGRSMSEWALFIALRTHPEP